MSRIAPRSLDEIPEFKVLMEAGASTMGFMPEDGLIMAHCPEMLKGAGQLINSVLGAGTVDAGLKRMIGYITSQASGCHYCSAHTGFTALKNGVEENKMKAIWEYPTSELFSPKEKAALRLAHHAGIVPNGSTEEDFEELKKHFSKEEIVEIVFTISLYGFLNKFNSTIQTTIEEKPLTAYNKIKTSHE